MLRKKRIQTTESRSSSGARLALNCPASCNLQVSRKPFREVTVRVTCWHMVWVSVFYKRRAKLPGRILIEPIFHRFDFVINELVFFYDLPVYGLAMSASGNVRLHVRKKLLPFTKAVVFRAK